MKDMRLSNGVAPTSAFPNGVWERGSFLVNDTTRSQGVLVEKHHRDEQEQQQIETQTCCCTQRHRKVQNIKGGSSEEEQPGLKRHCPVGHKVNERFEKNFERTREEKHRPTVPAISENENREGHQSAEEDSKPPSEANFSRRRRLGLLLTHDGLGLDLARRKGNSALRAAEFPMG